MGPESSKSWYLPNVDRRNPAPRSLAMSAASADSGSGETTSSWIYARGLITYILAIGTVAVALVSVVSALLGTDGRAAPCDHQSQRANPLAGTLIRDAHLAGPSPTLWRHHRHSPKPRHERLGVREHTRPACSFDQSSSARASMVLRWNEVGLLPVRANKAFTSEALHARHLLYYVAASAGRAQATQLVCRQNLISKSAGLAAHHRFQSNSMESGCLGLLSAIFKEVLVKVL
jgi:hypothetical protein